MFNTCLKLFATSFRSEAIVDTMYVPYKNLVSDVMSRLGHALFYRAILRRSKRSHFHRLSLVVRIPVLMCICVLADDNGLANVAKHIDRTEVAREAGKRPDISAARDSPAEIQEEAVS